MSFYGNAGFSNTDETMGQQAAASSISVALATEQFQDQFVTGQSGQSNTVNNILTATAGSAATDVSNYRSFVITIVSTATSGTYIFEGSMDNSTFYTITVFGVTASSVITSTIQPTAGTTTYVGATNCRYIRCRIASTLGGGTIQAFSRFSLVPYANNQTYMSSGVLASSSTTDVSSSAITSTTTTSAISISQVSSLSFNVAVTANSGTGQTMDIVIQESIDGTNWYDIYHFERISGNGFWVSPMMRMTGTQIRYVQTIAGASPSFTRVISRYQRCISSPIKRRLFDRAINPNSLNSTTAALYTDGCDRVAIVQSSAAGAAVNPVFTLEGSEDNSNWYQLSSAAITVTGAPSTNTNNFATIGSLPKFVRARVSTAGTSAVLNYIALVAQG